MTTPILGEREPAVLAQLVSRTEAEKKNPTETQAGQLT